MYDSRSSHARSGTHALRSYREHGEGDRIEYGTPKTRVLATKQAERLAIAEGLAEYAEMNARGGHDHVEPLDFHHLPGLSEIGRDRTWDAFIETADADYERWATEQDRDYDRRMARRPRVKVAERRTIAATFDAEERFTRREGAIPLVSGGKRRAAKQPFSRTSAPAFDPTLVSRTLSPAGVR